MRSGSNNVEPTTKSTLESLGIADPGKAQASKKTGRFLGLFRKAASPIVGGKRSKPHSSSKVVEAIFEGVSSDVVLGLDAAHLDIILMRIISQFSTNRKLVKKAQTLSYNIGAVKRPVGTRIGGVNLEEIAEVMETLLSTADNLPAGVVAYVHTYLGMIRQQQKRYDGAIDAFVKALWIRRSSSQPLELIAVASHRLGVVYSLNDDVEDAMVALKQAIQYYSKSPISMDHEFVVAAQNILFELKKNDDRPLLTSQRLPTKLFDIFERDEGTVTTADITEGGWSTSRRRG